MTQTTPVYHEILKFPRPVIGLQRPASYQTWNRDGRAYHAVYGYHYSSQAIELIRDNIEARLDDPQQWVFLVEGCDTRVRFGSERDEVSYATLLAMRSGIPCKDPVIDPTRPEILRYVKRQGVDEQLLYAAQLYALWETTQLFYYNTANYFSEHYGMSSERFAKLYERVRSANRQKRKEFGRIYDRLSRASTNLSREKLRQFLQEYKQPNVFLYFGKDHLPMIDFIRK